MPCRSSARSLLSREHNQKVHSVSRQKLLLLGIPGTSAPMTSRSGLCRSCGRPGRRGAWSTRPMVGACRLPTVQQRNPEVEGATCPGNRYLVGRMGGVRVLVRVNNRREGRLLPVPSAGVRTWLTQSLEHGRTAVAEREPPKPPPSPPRRARAGAHTAAMLEQNLGQ